MWSVIPSMDGLLQGLMLAFTQPSFDTHQQLFLGWLMCFGRRTEFRVFEAIDGAPVDRTQRHPFDRFYNFFSRSAWTVRELARAVARQAVRKLNRSGELLLAVDGTLLHKSGKHVFGRGWFHDPVASTQTRVATAAGNKWVVMGLVITLPGVRRKFCLPLHAMLDDPNEKLGEPELARRMLQDIREWFPDRPIVLVADGGFSAKTLLRKLDEQTRYVGLMRNDAALHDPTIPTRTPGQRGPNPKTGPRLPSPRQAFAKADRSRSENSPWRWTRIEAEAYGRKRLFDVCAFVAVWPKVFGDRPILVVLSRGLEAGYGDVCLYTTDLEADPRWVVETYASRNAIETMFKSSKQVMEIQKPQHWCQASIEKLAPWVWFAQSVVSLWYLTEGRRLPEAKAARKELGEWESEWSFRHLFRLLRRLTIRQTINAMSGRRRDMTELIESLENYLYLAV